MKDWIGGKKSVYTTLGASNHVSEERQEHDYYATDPIAVKLLLEREKFCPNILEPACGEGHLSKEIQKAGYNVYSFDLIDRGFGRVKNFFEVNKFKGDIITNPPYKFAQEFIEHSLDIIPKNYKVAMFLKLQFLEGQKRRSLFSKYPMRKILVSSKRIKCAKNGEFRGASNAVAYGWFIWVKGYHGSPLLEWIN